MKKSFNHLAWDTLTVRIIDSLTYSTKLCLLATQTLAMPMICAIFPEKKNGGKRGKRREKSPVCRHRGLSACSHISLDIRRRFPCLIVEPAPYCLEVLSRLNQTNEMRVISQLYVWRFIVLQSNILLTLGNMYLR